MLALRSHPEDLPSLGTQVQEGRQEGVRRMLLQMRASRCILRHMALQLYHGEREKRNKAQEGAGEIRYREREDLSGIPQGAEREGPGVGDKESKTKSKG